MHGAHRDLHSFPTRRSSDLAMRCDRGVLAAGHQPDGAGRQTNLLRTLPFSLYAPPAARSEEHTSELQSHVNLVCRLLLEKKKIRGRLFAQAMKGLYHHIYTV